MSVYQTKGFGRFARKAKLEASELLEAAAAVASGNWDADLGGGVFKQRIARRGGGKSGGFRTILLFKVGSHTFFVVGFAKNERASLTDRELRALKKLAAAYLAADLTMVEALVDAGEIEELKDDGEGGS